MQGIPKMRAAIWKEEMAYVKINWKYRITFFVQSSVFEKIKFEYLLGTRALDELQPALSVHPSDYSSDYFHV